MQVYDFTIFLLELLLVPGLYIEDIFILVCECPLWCCIVGVTVTVHQFFCILHLDVRFFYCTINVERWKVGSVNWVITHNIWMNVVTPTVRPQSVRNRCVIERFRGGFCFFFALLFINFLFVLWTYIALCVTGGPGPDTNLPPFWETLHVSCKRKFP